MVESSDTTRTAQSILGVQPAPPIIQYVAFLYCMHQPFLPCAIRGRSGEHILEAPVPPDEPSSPDPHMSSECLPNPGQFRSCTTPRSDQSKIPDLPNGDKPRGFVFFLLAFFSRPWNLNLMTLVFD